IIRPDLCFAIAILLLSKNKFMRIYTKYRTVPGTLFFDISKILKYQKTPIVILENVRNLVSHDNGKTWQIIKETLQNLGYIINSEPIVISPHNLGIPQLRERVIILAYHKTLNLEDFKIQLPTKNQYKTNIESILDKEADQKYHISNHEQKLLHCWDEFIKGIKFIPKKSVKTKEFIKEPFLGTIGFPVWADEFINKSLISSDNKKWKNDFIIKNHLLFKYNNKFIKNWLKKWNNLSDFTKTEKKLEWQCGGEYKSIWETIIQFRPSGVRVKKPDVFPALVAMVQLPIIGKYKRRITPKEASRLQSFSENFICNDIDYQAYKQFGNAVNVKVVEFIAKQLLDKYLK
ncbi:DNA (cytosine-5-)-methyltransferase, partial [Mycoplasma leonicaptivi]|uniref:DNA (cytosine-5-)-methyltransferase n=1 Tax=Mycoplasma leonicaptivi TaxID=36742 RepID=UPI0012EB32E1